MSRSDKMNAIRMHSDDSVAVLVEDVKAGDSIRLLGDGDPVVHAIQDIPYGHKVALRAMKAGDPVIKYGERMGVATRDIEVGAHVHVHNVRGLESEERRTTQSADV